MPEKIIFLDFDGPLSNHRVGAQTGSMKLFDPVAVGALNNICKVSNSKIVCTSVRAQLWHDDSFKKACYYFEQAGLDLGYLHEDWSCRYDAGLREGHILKWLDLHPDVTQYAIIDDGLVDLPNFVRVDTYNGIGFNDFQKVAALLGTDMSKVFNVIANKKDPDKEALGCTPKDTFRGVWKALKQKFDFD